MIDKRNNETWKAWRKAWDEIIYGDSNEEKKKNIIKQFNPDFTYESTLKFLQEYYPEIKWTKSEDCYNTITEPNKITVGIYSNVWYVSFDYQPFQNYQPTTTKALIEAIAKVQRGELPY